MIMIMDVTDLGHIYGHDHGNGNANGNGHINGNGNGNGFYNAHGIGNGEITSRSRYCNVSMAVTLFSL